ncbi:hypothetical protein Tco_0101742, partial [Tanacetum coccineum]
MKITMEALCLLEVILLEMNLTFKLLDESQLVLKAPRKDDVYSLDLKNIVPSRVLTRKGTDEPNEGTVEPNEGIADLKDGNLDESAAPTTIFRDDETIAQFLVTMNQNKTKQKGFEIKDTDRPKTATERSILTCKPLPKIDLKDNGKKVLEEKAKSDAESEGVNEAERKFA